MNASIGAGFVPDRKPVNGKKVRLWPDAVPGGQGDGPEDVPTLTPFLIESDRPVPAVIVFPGGGYGMRAEHEREPIARWLNTLGISAFVLDYRVAPYRHPSPLLDAGRAIQTVRHFAPAWGINPNQIGVIGFSAGGHLAASTATLLAQGDLTPWFESGFVPVEDGVSQVNCRPDFAMLCYPVITFGQYGHQGSAENLLGPTPDPKLREQLSLHRAVTEATPPVFLWHTSDDAVVSVENSLMFASALSGLGIQYALHVFPSGPHGLGLAEDDSQASAWTRLAARWISELGQ